MELTINSRKLKRELTFSRPGSEYLYVDLNGQPGTLGNQMGESGSCSGNMLSYTGENYDHFCKICRRWYRAYLRNVSNY